LRICDFGISQVAARKALELSHRSTPSLSLAPTLRGAHTPLYASPQQKLMKKPDVRDDVFALGVIWHQLLLGDLTRERPAGKWRKRVAGLEVDDALLDLLEECVDDDPDERPRDAAELAEWLASKPAPPPVISPPPVAVAQPAPKQPTAEVPPAAPRKPVSVLSLRISTGIEMKFAWISPGEFLMGCDKYDSEKPVHRVTLTKGFYMGVFLVTQSQWQAVMNCNPSHFRGDDRPVEKVSWGDCQEFWQKLKQLTGKPIRLPTEAEWEYACRAGTTTEYYTGNGEDALCKAGWYNGNSDSQTHPVGKLAANARGLYDTHGNVWEWCQDWYGPYSSENKTDPKSSNYGDGRVLRGGSWDDQPVLCRAAYRGRYAPAFRDFYCGCRVCFLLD
jgi:formylglycine-generating enzyme required for sulfatase activity